jgi:pectate lyase
VQDRVRVLVNNRPVIAVRDASLSGGRPGLMTYRAQVDFDNVLVHANPAATAFTTDFGQSNTSWDITAGDWAQLQRGINWVFRQSDLTGGARASLSGGMRSDQIVEADLRPTQFSGVDRWFGLMARYRDDSNYHYVTLRTSNTLEIKKLVNGAIQTLSRVPFTVQANVSYRVRLETIGARVRVYVNGTLRAEATDASAAPARSSVGVASYKAAMDSDNFVVTQP